MIISWRALRAAESINRALPEAELLGWLYNYRPDPSGISRRIESPPLHWH